MRRHAVVVAALLATTSAACDRRPRLICGNAPHHRALSRRAWGPSGSTADPRVFVRVADEAGPVSEPAMLILSGADGRRFIVDYLVAGVFEARVPPGTYHVVAVVGKATAIADHVAMVRSTEYRPILKPITGAIAVEGTASPLDKFMPVASVLFEDGSRLFGTTTDSKGRYSIALPPGTYRVVAIAEGMASAITTVKLTRDAHLDLGLQSPQNEILFQPPRECENSSRCDATVSLVGTGLLHPVNIHFVPFMSNTVANVPPGEYRVEVRWGDHVDAISLLMRENSSPTVAWIGHRQLLAIDGPPH